MKDLITIFTYCPTYEKRKLLLDLVKNLQSKRDKFDLMVVSHSSIPEIIIELVDYYYYDKENILIRDFNLTNKFWFREENITINSSLVYPVSTHLAIYRLIYYTLNFSKFMGYSKTHFIEYDIKMDDFDLIDEVNEKLNEYDNVMFKGNDDWVWGVYFATKNTYDIKDFIYNERQIMEDLCSVENRMTEYVTPKMLSTNGRTILYESIDKIDKEQKCQWIDEHLNDKLIWCVPVVYENGDELCFFIFNEKGGDYIVDLFINDIKTSFNSGKIGIWYLHSVGSLSETNKIEIFVDGEWRNKILLNEDSKESFRKNNFYKYIQ
jgi:hypothetical protein